MKKTSAISAMLIVKLTLALFLTCGLILSLQGCNKDSGNNDNNNANQPGSQAGDSSQNTANESSSDSASDEEISLTLYFVEDYKASMFLVGERRTVPIKKEKQNAATDKTSNSARKSAQALAKTAVEELIKGPTHKALKKKGVESLIPKDTKVLSVTIVGELATVDFSREVLNANVGSEAAMLGIYQIVNTLTEIPMMQLTPEIASKPSENTMIRRVRFTVEGDYYGTIEGRSIEDWWGHVGLGGQPFERISSFIKGAVVNTDSISVESPRANTAIRNPLIVEGAVQVFEATLQACVKDANGKVLADELVTATDFNWGTFKKTIEYDQPQESGRGTVLFYYESPKDGSKVTLGSVPVYFTE